MKPSKAETLIKRSALRAPPVPPEALAELRKLVEHNDSISGMHGRVAAPRAVELLQSYGVRCGGRESLDKICRELLGRKSYGTR